MAGSGVSGEEILYRQSELLARAMGADEAQIAKNVALQKKLFAQIKQDTAGSHIAENLKKVLDAIESPEERQATEQALQSQAGMLDSPWFRTFLVLDPRTALRRVTCPVLAIIGEKDLQVDPSQNLPEIAAALKAGGNLDATTVELPGLNHLFQTCETGTVSEYGQIDETIAPAALQAISDWISARTK